MRNVMLALAVMAGFMTAMFVLAPLVAPYGMYHSLDGSPCFIDHSWSISDFPYLIGDILCHQEQDRSFILNGSQMPVCSRDIGLIFGLTLGCLFCLSWRIHAYFDNRWLAMSVVMMLFTVVEWFIDPYFDNLMETRFATGIVSGAGTGMLIGWIVHWKWMYDVE